MNRICVPFALSILPACLAFDLALADSNFAAPTHSGASVACHANGAGVSCSHFEGYIVVRRHDAALPASATSSEAAMSERRVYLPVGAAP